MKTIEDEDWKEINKEIHQKLKQKIRLHPLEVVFIGVMIALCGFNFIKLVRYLIWFLF